MASVNAWAAVKALVLLEASGHKENMANIYGNFGIAYRIRGDLEQAEAMYRKSLALFQDIGGAPRKKGQIYF